jgi:hypothetical protein
MGKYMLKPIASIAIVFMLFYFAVPVGAWPNCGNCCYWDSQQCQSLGKWYCCDCIDCYWVDNDAYCIGCYTGCKSCLCETCECWDTGDAICGSITVQDATLCEQRTHTSSVSDTDHLIVGDYIEEWPFDSMTYSWDKIAGSNPQSGTWKSDTNNPNVAWQAPPCVGTVTIKLTADDVPNQMNNPCPESGSTRDDAPKDYQDTATVSLPSGCSEGDASTVWFISTKLTDCEHCGISCGRTGPMYLPTITIPLPTYSDSKWIFSVYADGETPCVVCPHLFTEITDGSDPDITAGNLCNILDAFTDEEPYCPPYGNSTCIQIHEDMHYTDWLICLQEQELWMAARSSMSDMTIDCSDSTTTTCQAAKAARQSAIVADVMEAWSRATDAWNAIGEDHAIAAAAPCFSDLVDSICTVWDCTVCQ